MKVSVWRDSGSAHWQTSGVPSAGWMVVFTRACAPAGGTPAGSGLRIWRVRARW
jgi:hypothetical protein